MIDKTLQTLFVIVLSIQQLQRDRINQYYILII